MEIGIKHNESCKVTKNNAASVVGSGALDVFATPSMIALMEMTCAAAVSSELEEGFTTVGTSVNVKHLSATPIGMNVVCECTLEEIDGRRLVFSVTAKDEKGVIGTGTHERFIVRIESFMKKTNAKID